MAEKLKFDIIVISHNNCSLTLQCIKSVYDSNDLDGLSVILVDNDSKDETIKKVKNLFPKVKIIYNTENLGYSKAVNIGVNFSKSDFVIVSNNDVIFPGHSITELISYLATDPDAGVIAPQQQYVDMSWEPSYGDLPGFRMALKDLFMITSLNNFIRKKFWNYFKTDNFPKIVPYVDGAVLVIRREAFDQVGGFDEDYFFYTEEADFCYRLKQKGWDVVFNPRILVTHLRGGAIPDPSGLDDKRIKQIINSKILFCKKHLSFIETKFYIFCEYFHNLIVLVILNVPKSIFTKNLQYKNKSRIIDCMVKNWKEHLNG